MPLHRTTSQQRAPPCPQFEPDLLHWRSDADPTDEGDVLTGLHHGQRLREKEVSTVRPPSRHIMKEKKGAEQTILHIVGHLLHGCDHAIEGAAVHHLLVMR